MNDCQTINKHKYENIQEYIISRLHEMIQSGEIKLGERLPPERDLARILGVSRPSLRIGIYWLTFAGFLHSRQGSGTYVVGTNATFFKNNPLRLIAAIDRCSSNEIFEAKILLEIHITALAAEHAKSEHLIQMAEEVAGMFGALDEPEQFLSHFLQFHQSIALASNNQILNNLINIFRQISNDSKSLLVKNAFELKKLAKSHLQIYRAIRERNPEEAGLIMRDCLNEIQRVQRDEIPKLAVNGNYVNKFDVIK